MVLTLTTLFSSCTGKSKPLGGERATSQDDTAERKDNYKFEVVSEEKTETSYKAQLLEYALYNDTDYSKDALSNTILEIYHLNKDKDVFKTHKGPTIVGIYLFTSKDAMKDKAEWIVRLSKGPNEKEPEVKFNELKVAALNNTQDNI